MLPRAPLPLEAGSRLANTDIAAALAFDLTLICRLLPQPAKIYARSALPAIPRYADYAERLTTHPFASAFTTSSLWVVPLISPGTIVALRGYWSISPYKSQLMRPSKRPSCSCRTPSCYVAIPTLHDDRTDTFACFILKLDS